MWAMPKHKREAKIKLQIAKSRSLSGFSKLGGDPATSRHTSHSLRLLPSGPDRVHELLLREDQASIVHLCFQRVRGLSGITAAIASPTHNKNVLFESNAYQIDRPAIYSFKNQSDLCASLLAHAQISLLFVLYKTRFNQPRFTFVGIHRKIGLMHYIF